ncbi:MAG: hypothetical protein FWB85_03860 [Chitinispirillia bacterium]|nr:hypothetical protein [Chitinispirillia bacterium]MCL2241515.1 hypothetical protein [Chitinispirillia bacterium]
MTKSVMLKALAFTALCFSVAFAQAVVGGAKTGGGGGGSNTIAAYVFGGDDMKGDLAEELAEALANNLVRDGKYSHPRRGARGFFKEVQKAEDRLGRRGKLLDDRDFCKIGDDEGVQYLVVLDIQKAGRGTSVRSRILDLGRCQVGATSDYIKLIRNTAEVNTAAAEISAELLKRFRPAPPPPPRGNQIAGYVFGGESVAVGEELAEAIVNGLTNTRSYSAPRRGARGFFREVEKAEARLNRRGQLLDDKDFCKVGSDYEIEYLVIIDIQKAGRGVSVFARVLDLEKCTIIATGESTKLARNTQEIAVVANEIVSALQHRRIGKRGDR